MYETFSMLAERAGKPWARRLARVALHAAGTASAIGTHHIKLIHTVESPLQRSVMGLSFPSPLGLAAGFDKCGTLYPVLSGLGFGFAEIGSVVPQPEEGRSPGLTAVVAQLGKYPVQRPMPLGVSISMNRASSPIRIPQDYLDSLGAVWQIADYITLNLGVRAGPDLHSPEHRSIMRTVLASVKNMQSTLETASGYRRPIAVKLDADRGNMDALLDSVQEFGFDGLVLSGGGCEPETVRRLEQLDRVVHRLQRTIPIIAVGGIRTPQDARACLQAGASLLQIYSGLVASGPYLVRRINRYLTKTITGSSQCL